MDGSAGAERDVAAAQVAVDLAGERPSDAARMARAVLRRPQVTTEARAVAERALGLAAREGSDFDAAAGHLRRAVRLASRGGLPVRVSEARMSLALALHGTGRTAAAMRELDRALEAVDGLAAARLSTQRALVLQRLGRFDEALAEYDEALPVIRREGDGLWESRLRTNRGVLHASLGSWTAAERDLHRARALEEQLGLAPSARYNLGYVAALRGDVPTALERYDEAEQAFRQTGVDPSLLLANRAEVLLSVPLVEEGRREAEKAVTAYAAQGRSADLAEARLVLARAALLAGDSAAACVSADAALTAFRRQRRPPWALLARSLLVQAAFADGVRTAALSRRARLLADELDQVGWTGPSVDARLTGARVTLELGRHTRAQSELAQVAAARGRGTVEVRVGAWHAEALRRAAAGDRAGARRAADAGIALVDRYRSALGSTELRAYASGHAVELAKLGLGLALETGSGRHVLRWSERWRAGALRARPARPEADGELTRDLAALRVVATELERAALAGRDPRPLARRQADLEQAVRRRSRHARGDSGPSSRHGLDIPALLESLGDRTLVEFVGLAGRLHAVVVGGGRVCLRSLGDRAEPERELESLRFSLRRLAHARGSAAGAEAAAASLRHAAVRLDELLLGPVRGLLGGESLVFVPTGALHALPWSLLPSCRGRPVTVSPSALLWERARRGAVAAGGDEPVGRRSEGAAGAAGAAQHGVGAGRSVVLVGGPEPAYAAREAAELATHYPAARALVGSAATARAVATAIDGAVLAHVACHGRFRADNPLFSSLDLADGPLTVYDLEALRVPPQMLVLSACDTGLSGIRPGDELMGVAAALLAMGTRSLVASVVPVPDEATRRLMTAFHDGLRRGHRPAEALATAQLAVDDDDRTALVAAAGFVCFGAG